MRTIVLLLIAVLCTSTCRGETAPSAAGTETASARTLTLEQALELADRKNRDIEKAREYYHQVQGKYVEERSAALPQLTLNASILGQEDKSQSAIAGGLFPTRQDVRTAEVDFSQALYTWGKIGAAMRAAEKGIKTADERLRIARQNTRRDVTVAFYDTLLAREQHGIALQNLIQKKQHQEEAERRYAAGVATDYDVLAAQVAVVNANPEVIRTANQVTAARDRLRFLLATPEDIDVTGSLETAVQPEVVFEQALQVARRRRPELEELRRTREIYQELVTIDKAADKPRLDLKGGLGWRQLDVGGQSGSGQVWAVGVYLSYPFFDGFKTRGKVAQTESQERSLQIDEAKQVEGISLEIRDAINGMKQAAEIVTALSRTVVQAERLLDMAEKGFQLGVKLRLEVEDAELNLRQARGNLARARRDYLVAGVSLERAMGTLGETK